MATEEKKPETDNIKQSSSSSGSGGKVSTDSISADVHRLGSRKPVVLG